MLKKLLLLAVAASPLLHASNSRTCSDSDLRPLNSLYEFTVFSKTHIHSQNSDILGNVGAGSNVDLRNFYIDGVLWSSSSISLNQANVRTEIAAPRFNNLFRTGFRKVRRTDPFGGQQLLQHKNTLDDLSHRLRSFETNLGASVRGGVLDLAVIDTSSTVQAITLNSSDFEKILALNFTGPKHVVFVINVLGSEINVSHLGIHGIEDNRTGVRLLPNQIIWNFPNASSLTMARSGTDLSHKINTRSHGVQNLGLPGFIIAPHASVQISDMAITGGIHSKSVQHIYAERTPGAQVNGDYPPEWERIFNCQKK